MTNAPTDGASATSSAIIAGARLSIVENLAAALAVSGPSPDAALLSAATTVLANIASATLSSSSSTPPSASLDIAVGISSAVGRIVNASGASLSVTAANSLLSAMGNALASTAAETPAVATPPAGFNASRSVPPVTIIPTGGSPPALVAAVSSTLNQLTAALLSSSASGQSQSVSTAPDAASAPGGAYCGAGVTSSAVKLDGSTPLSFSVSPALNPCNSRDANLPADVGLPPPPSITTTSAVAAALAVAAPGANVGFTQWGVSPFNETSTAVTTYPAPPSLSDLQLAANLAAAQALASSTARRLAARFLGATAVDAVLAAVGGKSAASAVSESFTEGSPRPTTASDLLPGRPLDSRVVSIQVTGPTGKTVSLARGTFAFNVTVPFRDLSIVKWDAALKTATIDVGNSGFSQPTISVKCPTSPAAAVKGIAAVYVSGGTGAAAVTLVNTKVSSFTSVIGTTNTAGTGDPAMSSVTAPGAASVSTDLLALPAAGGGSGSRGQNISVGAMLSAKAPTVAASSYSYILSTFCGAAFGNQQFVCGAGFEGQAITFACPAVVALPACLRWNESRSAWLTTGCTVASTSATSAVCSCDGPGSVAVRFAALAQQQVDVFAVGSAASVTSLLAVWNGTFAMLGAIFFVFLLTALIPIGARSQRFLQIFAASPEMAWLRSASALNGDALWSLSAKVRASAKVAPDGPRSRTTSASTVSISPTARVVPINGAGSVSGDAVSRNSALAPLGATIRAWSKHAAVAPSPTSVAKLDAESSKAVGHAFSMLPADSRAAVVRADVGALGAIFTAWREHAGQPPPKPSKPSPVGAIARARLCSGEPPAILLTLWPLLQVARARFFFDATSDALAAPAHVRLLGAIAAITISTAGTLVLYANLLAMPTAAGSPAFQALSSSQVFALALANAFFISAPLDALVLALVRWRARVSAHASLPGLAGEIVRRRRASAVLGPLPTSALIRFVGAASGDESAKSFSEEDASDADSNAPPGWDAPPPQMLLNAAPGILTLFGRHPDQREEAAAAAAAAASAVGLDQDSSDALVRATLVANIRESFAALPVSAPVPIAVMLLADAALALLCAFCTFYAVSFSFTRGAVATSSAAAAWVLGVSMTLLIVRPAAVYARVAVAFASGGTCRVRHGATHVAPLLAYHTVVSTAAAAASVAGPSVATVDAAAAIVAPEALAALAARAANPFAGAHISLREAVLVRAYLLLVAPDAPPPQRPQLQTPTSALLVKAALPSASDTQQDPAPVSSAPSRAVSAHSGASQTQLPRLPLAITADALDTFIGDGEELERGRDSVQSAFESARRPSPPLQFDRDEGERERERERERETPNFFAPTLLLSGDVRFGSGDNALGRAGGEWEAAMRRAEAVEAQRNVAYESSAAAAASGAGSWGGGSPTRAPSPPPHEQHAAARPAVVLQRAPFAHARAPLPLPIRPTAPAGQPSQQERRALGPIGAGALLSVRPPLGTPPLGARYAAGALRSGAAISLVHMPRAIARGVAALPRGAVLSARPLLPLPRGFVKAPLNAAPRGGVQPRGPR